jgi:Kef-type K+ transport system membrane component KefB
MPYLPYEEPGITGILSLTSFLLLLNGVRYALDRLLYCGIVGEILIGVVWGLPVGGTAWLNKGIQEAIQAFGYLGLIGLVFEGGLSTDLSMLRKTAYMSISIATIGLLMPIALSFILLALPFSSSAGTTYPTPLAGFSAGASLCSTSLGTTFAILSSANLQRTRVGVVLVGAAMMDDVVGLVMVNIVTSLGNGKVGGWPVARPIAASFGLLLVTLALAPFVLRPIWRWVCDYLSAEAEVDPTTNLKTSFRKWSTTLAHNIPHLNFVLSTAVLILFVTIASFIDASVLFAAFIGGGVVNFLYSVRPASSPTVSTSDESPSNMYQQYYKSVMDFILVPFFFVSNSLICYFRVRSVVTYRWPRGSPILQRESCHQRFTSREHSHLHDALLHIFLLCHGSLWLAFFVCMRCLNAQPPSLAPLWICFSLRGDMFSLRRFALIVSI